MQAYVRVGEPPLDLRDMDVMPPGTRIVSGSREYIRQPDGTWDWNGTRYYSNQFRPSNVRVVSYPEGVDVRQRPPETLERYMWRFRDYALWQAYSHSVSYEASRDVLNALKTDLPLGRGVVTQNERLWQELPPGSMVFRGNPEIPAQFAVYEKSNGRWNPVIGTGTVSGYPVTIYRVGMDGTAEPEWLTRVSTDEQAEADRIADFKANVWRAGWSLKQSQGWCSTYEAILREFGITRGATRRLAHGNIRVGSRVPPESAATLPLGSVLRWRSSTDARTWGLYVRASNADNAAHTIKVGGSGTCDSRNYHSSMEVIWLASPGSPQWEMGESSSTAQARELMDGLVPGVTFENNGNRRPDYVKALDGRFTSYERDGRIPTQGQWRPADFGDTLNITILNYPGVTL